MSTNPPSFRLPFAFKEDVHPQVKDAMRLVFQALANHEQAFSALTAKVNALPTASTTNNVTSSGVQSGAVNDQSATAAPVTQQSDNGALVKVGGVAVTLNSKVTKPWYAKVTNTSGSNATLTPDVAGATINGSPTLTLAPGASMNVYINTDDFNWSAA